jgi:hypothetical protein
MTDLEAQIRAVNPLRVSDLREDDLPLFNAVWLAVEQAALSARRRPRMGFVLRTALRTPRGWVALAATTGAVVVAVLVLSAGTTPTDAQAFPILNQRGSDISSNAAVHHALAGASGALATWIPSTTALFDALESAHSFTVPAGVDANGPGIGRGYLLQSPDGSFLCLVLIELGAAGQPGSLVHSAFGPVVCTSTANAEADGLVAVGDASAYETDGNVFVALVPAGATVTLTDSGTTTPVAINDGIATGTASSASTLSIGIAGVTQTTQLAASTEPWWPPSSPATSSTSAAGSTAASGATVASGSTTSGTTGTS